MVVQIFSITTVDQAVMCANVGVDNVGIRVGSENMVPWELGVEEGKAIVDALKGKAKSIVITSTNDVAEIVEFAGLLKPDFIQILAKFEDMDLEERGEARKQINDLGIKTINGLPLIDESSISLAKNLAKFTDAIILETVVNTEEEMGSTGLINDWNLAAKVVEEVGIPVIMSGGLGPENVRACIEKVKPWGVDSMTKTDVYGTNHMQKDIELVRSFVEEVRSIG